MLEKIKREGAKNLAEYLSKEKIKSELINRELGLKYDISPGEVSKLLSLQREGVKAEAFYDIYKASEDNLDFESFIAKIYPSLVTYVIEDSTVYKEKKKRNAFGTFILQFEVQMNTLNLIAVRTGITEKRLKELYYEKGALRAHELILIEKALEKKPGELFIIYYNNKEKKDVKK